MINNKKFLIFLFVLYIFLTIPNYCNATENISDTADTQVMHIAVDAMKLNACAIKVGENIICVVKDNMAAESVIDAFYCEFAKCENNEVLVDIGWAEKPEIVNVKENIFNIIEQRDALNLMISMSTNKTDSKVAALSAYSVAKVNNAPLVALTKYVKETQTTDFDTNIEYSDTLYQNQSQVKQKGIDGVKENIYKVVYINDVEQSRELIKSKETIKQQNEIIIKGTKIKKLSEYAIPAYGFLSSPYGERNGTMHLGVDIANSKDTEIFAFKDGIVAKVEWYYGYGKCIDIEHYDGSWTRYGHLNEFLVNVGDKVNQGQQIGLMGTTGNSTGYHLHFEIRYGKWPYGRTIDPSYILDLSKLKE